MEKTIILAPHPDDEIFAIRKLPASKEKIITVLFLSGNEQRIQEAHRSCEYLGFQPLILEDEGLKLTDGLFHENIRSLTEKIIGICGGYDQVLCPALEGGHQDHDTTAVACISSIKLLEKKGCEVKFYPCYTSWRETALYKVASSSSYLQLMQKKSIGPMICNKQQYHLAFQIYKSQIKTWAFLYPFMILRQILKKEELIYVLPSSAANTGLSIITNLKQRPLYESHGRLTLVCWKNSYLNAD